MSSHLNCCVYGCSNTYKKAKEQGRTVKFHKFPTKPWLKDRRLAWIQFVKRITTNGKPWQPTRYSTICSDHFIGGSKSEDPRSPSYNPMVHPAMPNKISAPERYKRLLQRESKQSVSDGGSSKVCVPSPKRYHQKSSQTESSHAIAYSWNQNKSGSTLSLLALSCSVNGNDVETMVNHKETTIIENKTFCNAGSGPEYKTPLFYGFSSLTESSVKDLTSLSPRIFQVILSLFSDHTSRIPELSIQDKLLLTFMKLKSGLPFKTIAVFFGVHRTTATRIFDAVILHIYICTKDWIFFPCKEAVQATLPQSFKEKYPTCRVIIDCTEIRTETPPNVDQRIHMYSNYKSCYTAKYLIGITPLGLISFISKGYGGRATDAYITNNCGILDLLEDGDTILADKGFPNIQINQGVLLVMPPFSQRNVKQFSCAEMEETYKVASVRIHVERAIQRVKIFNIIGSTVPVCLIPKLDMILHVCCLMVNLSSPIIKE